MCLGLAACYAPLNNSGMSTNKAWLEIPAKKTNFDGKPYDICYQFNLHIIPLEAQNQLDLQESCLSNCCWLSDKEEVVLDFNKNFEKDLAIYGQAQKYTPEKITLKFTHADWLNTAAVHISPRGAIKSDGTLKLKYQTVQDPVRLAQVQQENRRAQVLHNANEADRQISQSLTPSQTQQARQRALELLQRTEENRIDTHFYLLDKKHREKGHIFLISKRLYSNTAQADGTYQITCQALVQSGPDTTQLQNRTLSCGVWNVNLSEQTVSPKDSIARNIHNQ